MMATAQAQPNLFIKSFFGDSVEETLDQARIELGPDALLLNVRDAAPDARHLGAFEVVFGADPGPVSAPGPRVVERSIVEIPQEPPDRVLAVAAQRALQTAPDGVACRLVARGLSEPLAADVAQCVGRAVRLRSAAQIGRRGEAPTQDELTSEIAAELERRFQVAPSVGSRCALIGPPGAGKTTTLMKLAVARGLALGRPVTLISIDQIRIGAAAQFQAYASVLEAECLFADTTSDLEKLLARIPAERLVLIDTPGLTAAALEDPRLQLAAYLSQRQDLDIQLVLPASMRDADLTRTLDRFLSFSPAKLLFTRIDETDALGSVVSQAARTAKPLSYFANGPLVPEDLAPADKRQIAQSLACELPVMTGTSSHRQQR